MALPQVWNNKNRKGLIFIKGICYIIAACKDTVDDIVFYPDEKDLIIAADGGYDILKSKNIVPDILLGDFDSIEKIPNHPNIVKHPVCKDDTDTFLAYKLAYEKRISKFYNIWRYWWAH